MFLTNRWYFSRKGLKLPRLGESQSPENYVGYNRTQGFVSPERVVIDKQVFYSVPQTVNLNQWALSGEWTMGKESIVLNRRNGKIIYRFHARDLHLIIGPQYQEML